MPFDSQISKFQVASGIKNLSIECTQLEVQNDGTPACLLACLPACLSAMTPVADAGDLIPSSLTVVGWSYHPVVETGQADAFVALRTPDQLPTTIIGLYCVPQGDGTWEYYSWDNTTYDSAIAWVADQEGVDRATAADAFGELPLDIEVLLDPETETTEPILFTGGLKATDPLHPVVASSPDPHTTVEVLEMLGHPAVATLSVASTTSGSTPIDPSDLPDDCVRVTADQWMTSLKNTYDLVLADPMASEQDVLDELYILRACCIPFWFHFPPSSTPWSCGSFALDSVSLDSQLGMCTYVYFRIATRTQTRTRIELLSNCTTKLCVQTRSCAGEQFAYCYTPAMPALPSGYTCSGTVCPAPTVSTCAPDSSVYCNPWHPSPCP